MHACMYANLIFYTYVCVLSGFAAGPGSGPCPAAKPDKTHTRRVGRLIDLPYGLSQVSFLFCDERYGQLRSLLPQRQTCRDTRWTKKAHGRKMEWPDREKSDHARCVCPCIYKAHALQHMCNHSSIKYKGVIHAYKTCITGPLHQSGRPLPRSVSGSPKRPLSLHKSVHPEFASKCPPWVCVKVSTLGLRSVHPEFA